MARNEAAVWNKFSGIYDAVNKNNKTTYRQVIKLINRQLNENSRVLEVATGTGEFSLGIAAHVDCVEAVDLSRDMIETAKNKASRMGVSNVRFSVQDAYALPYDTESFDIVIIANTLHIMPQPERALVEIKRVLAKDSIMIAPTFVYAGNKKAALLSKLMTLTGFRAYHKWTEQSYMQFLKDNGFAIIDNTLLKASFPLAYVVAKRVGE